MTLHTIDIIMCAIGFYAIGYFITSGIWALIRVIAKRPRTENYWKRLYLLSLFSWFAVISFIIIGFEILVVGFGMAIEEKVKGDKAEDEDEPENVN